MLKLKTNDMNYDARNGATGQPISINNEATSYAAVFAGTAPAPTDSATAGAALGWGLYCNHTTTMSIWILISN